MTTETSEQVSGDAVTEGLRRIIQLDQHKKRTAIDIDPAGNTYEIEDVDGPCATIARELLSARTSTAPVAWVPAHTLDIVSAGSAVWALLKPKHDAGSEPVYHAPIYASPPPPQPAVTVTDDAVRLACDTYERAEEAVGHPMRCRFGAMQDALRAALAATVSETGRGR